MRALIMPPRPASLVTVVILTSVDVSAGKRPTAMPASIITTVANTATIGTKRRPSARGQAHGEIARLAGAAGEQQVRHIRDREDQQEGGGSERDECDRADVADDG